MLLWEKVINDLSHLNSWLISDGLSNEYNVNYVVNKDLALIEAAKKEIILTPPTQTNNGYVREFLRITSESDYSFVLKDGAILQCYYTIKADKLLKQKFTFYESPFIEDKDEQTAAEIMEYEIKACPQSLRFDYDPLCMKNVVHPAAHFTVGNNKDCRIPVAAPMTVANFIKFIVKNFYHEHWGSFNAFLAKNRGLLKEEVYDNEITEEEMKHIHIGAPAPFDKKKTRRRQ